MKAVVLIPDFDATGNMAGNTFRFGVLAAFLYLISAVSADVNVDDLFAVQSGRTDGGCDAYYNREDQSGVLDDWVSECSFSVDNAITAIENYNQNVEVRRAMQAWFGIRNIGPARGNTATKIASVARNIQYVQEFFLRATDDNGNPFYPLGQRYLYCDSTFLVHQSDDTVAFDYQAEKIVDAQNKDVLIRDVPAYEEAIQRNPENEAWWSGFLTDTNGYYFSDTGGEYCDGSNLGLTSTIQPLVKGPNGEAQNRPTLESVVLCPSAFTNPALPATYRIANQMITTGTNLALVMPRSTTLLHEMFHVLLGAGDEGFLGDTEEFKDIAECTRAAMKTPDLARRNPENYVFFIVHMYHSLGTDEGDRPESIPTNWNFFPTEGTPRTYAAIVPP